ncbi:metallophosphoesterase family protein [Cytophagaceae bacterium ABcell3]|nr:metallophosphoesterase family protein [Cytophagaceae bacterium ABcell3]
MTRIGVISDTHGYLDPKVFNHFEDCDQVWHAGDFGTLDISEALEAHKPLKGVYGNIDGSEIRLKHPETLAFQVEALKVLMIHIGGYPGKYPAKVKQLIKKEQPDIFVCGHSHILKVMTDRSFNNMLAINPGAAGIQGFHHIRTLLKFDIENDKIVNMKAIELGKRGEIKKGE